MITKSSQLESIEINFTLIFIRERKNLEKRSFNRITITITTMADKNTSDDV